MVFVVVLSITVFSTAINPYKYVIQNKFLIKCPEIPDYLSLSFIKVNEKLNLVE